MDLGTPEWVCEVKIVLAFQITFDIFSPDNHNRFLASCVKGCAHEDGIMADPNEVKVMRQMLPPTLSEQSGMKCQ